MDIRGVIKVAQRAPEILLACCSGSDVDKDVCSAIGYDSYGGSCDTFMDEHCKLDTTSEQCSCYNSIKTPAVCYSPTCVNKGYLREKDRKDIDQKVCQNERLGCKARSNMTPEQQQHMVKMGIPDCLPPDDTGMNSEYDLTITDHHYKNMAESQWISGLSNNVVIIIIIMLVLTLTYIIYGSVSKNKPPTSLQSTTESQAVN